MLEEVQHDPPATPGRGSLVRRALRKAVAEGARLLAIAETGDSPAALAILAGAALVFIIPLVALVIALAFAAAHYA